MAGQRRPVARPRSDQRDALREPPPWVARPRRRRQNSLRAEMPRAMPVLAPLRTDGAADRDHGPHPDAESASEVSMDEYLRVEVHRGDGLTAVNAAGEID